MKIEYQLISIEHARRLKELGVRQESLFYWHIGDDGEYRIYRFGMIAENLNDLEKTDFSAFTVAELGEMLPIECDYNKTNPGTLAYIKIGHWLCALWGNDNAEPKYMHREFANTEAEARAKMLIYLIENKLINNQTKNREKIP